MRYRFMRFPGGREKAVTLSYDDGYPTDIKFSEIITKVGLKCTFNLNSKTMRPVFMTKEQVIEHIIKKGHEIAIHGTNHRAQGTLRPIEDIRDVLDCRIELEERYGVIIRGMAYPDTGINHFANDATYDNIKRYLEDLGVVYARTWGDDNNSFELPVTGMQPILRFTNIQKHTIHLYIVLIVPLYIIPLFMIYGLMRTEKYIKYHRDKLLSYSKIGEVKWIKDYKII